MFDNNIKEMLERIYLIPCTDDCNACKEKYGTRWCPKHYCDEYKGAILSAKANKNEIQKIVERMTEEEEK